jgi:hypothetical protein
MEEPNMIQDTTPYSAYLGLLGGGPGALQNGGVGVGAATGAMAQILQDTAAQNQGLNVTAQDTANQQAQEALAQSKIQTPVQQAKATQDIQTAQQATQAGAQYGPEMLASQAQASIAKNYTGKTVAEREQHESQMKDWVDANNLISDDHFDWKNPEHTTMLKKELSKGGMQDIPENLTESNIPQIQAGAAMAVKSLELTRQMKLGETQQGYAMEQLKEKGKTEMAVAELQGQVGIYKMLAGLPDTSRAVLLARKEAFENGGTVSTETMAAATAAIRSQVLSQPDIMAAINAHEAQNFQTESGKTIDLVVADAKSVGLNPALIARLEKAGDKEELAKQIARVASTKEKEDLVSTQVKARLPFHTDDTIKPTESPISGLGQPLPGGGVGGKIGNSQVTNPVGVSGKAADQLMAVYKQNPKNKGFSDDQLLQFAIKAGKISPNYVPGQ